MKPLSYITIFIFFILNSEFLILNSNAQIPTPAPKQSETILLLNGIAHLGNGNVIENSAIGFENGKLILVVDATTIRLDKDKYKKIIEIPGKHVYPGFISPNSTLGLMEIGAVRATRDMNEVGQMNPNARSIIAYNTESKITSTVRSNGVLLAQITPRGGFISGTSSIVELDAWNWEDAVYKMDDGIHLNWPRMFYSTGWWGEPGSMKKNENRDKQIQKIKLFFDDAKAYSEIENQQEKDLRFEAMRGLFDGSKSLFIHTNFVKDITSAINFERESGVKKTILVGGYDSWMVADMLKENDVAVILRRVHELPERPEDDIDLPFKTPYLLHKAGVLFCLNNAGDMEQMNTRNLPFYAGTAAAHGLTKEEALMSITSNAAKILGIDDRVGTLELGKDATLIVSTGDALDVLTNNIEHAFIRGRQIDLDNHQKQLYDKYKKKYSTSQ
ncbi:MAG: amidohydrolase [Flavobacteriales bacterium]|nr:MAG: amidohydrolase [Flavobacteriales bacterium]